MSNTTVPKSIIDNLSVKSRLTHEKSNYTSGITVTDDAHIHNEYELYINVSGDVSFLVENTLYPIESGDIILTMPNEMHHCVYNSDGMHEHCCMWITPGGSLSGILKFLSKREKGKGNLIKMNPEDKKKAQSLFITLCKKFSENSMDSVASLADLFTLFALIDSYTPQNPSTAILPDTFKAILGYIEDNISSKCIGKDIASEFYISRSTLYRMFKENLNMTPAKYIESKRLSLAKTLLEEKKPIGEVCTLCGFNDYSHFIATFKKRFGITPYKYVKNYFTVHCSAY